MSDLAAFWLGITQGVTEFLPVSSSGHLAILQAYLGVGSTGMLFEVAVHVATLLAIVIYYFRRIAGLVEGVLRGQRAAWEYGGKLALATLPAVAVGLGARDFVELQFQQPLAAGFFLLLTGCALWTTRWTLPRASRSEPSWQAAFWIGCAQAVAIMPGISRSGATVAAALALGVVPLAAAEFSFLLGVIAIIGAAVLTIPDLDAANAELLGAIGIGSLAALASGVVALYLFVWLLRHQRFHLFSYYVWLLGAIVIMYYW